MVSISWRMNKEGFSLLPASKSLGTARVIASRRSRISRIILLARMRIGGTDYQIARIGPARHLVGYIALVSVIELFLCAAVSAQIVIRGEVPQRVKDVFIPDVRDVRNIRVSTWAEDLECPWSLVFLPNGNGLVSEQNSGAIVYIDKISLKKKPYAKLEVADCGIMGLALHPDFENYPFVYAAHCYRSGEETLVGVVRFVHLGDRGIVDRVIFKGFKGNTVRIGGRIKFGPDGMLYVGTGDSEKPDLAQYIPSFEGKILRLTPDGGIPDDNPWLGSPVFSYGHRNVQGIAWDPKTKIMFASDHGPSGERGVSHRDEINIITRAGNYGWPRAVGAPGIPKYRDPIVMWKILSVPPSGLAFWRGGLFISTLASQALVCIRFSEEVADYRITSIERWFALDGRQGVYGRLRDVTVGPDGHLYVLTNNRDGRSQPHPNDDRILRIEFRADQVMKVETVP